MKKLALAGLIGLVAATSLWLAPRLRPLEVGAVYPTKGTQGPGGLAEFRGVQLAAERHNQRAGTSRVSVHLEQADSTDQVPRAMERLGRRGVPVVLGSYGSTLSAAAAEIARREGLVFWETGAVGDIPMASKGGDKVFRFASTGEALGRSAVEFARDVLLPKLQEDPKDLTYGVAYVDDVYGRSVGLAAVDEITRSGFAEAASFPYSLPGADYASIVHSMADAGVDVLFVAAYLQDGIALRKETVRQNLPLIASVGTSSSYCMHEFGEALDEDAVGLFASDKPDGHILDPTTLSPGAGADLRWARQLYEKRFDHEMTSAALSGFAGALALFDYVLDRAASDSPAEIALAARKVRIPEGGLPNGSGLDFGADSTANLRATSVIWEWVSPGKRAVVWPPKFATSAVLALPIS